MLSRRYVAIVAMLVASLLLMGVLGWQAWRLVRSNDAVAESVLREYAIVAADEFQRRIIAELGYRGYYQLISRLDGSADPAELQQVALQSPAIAVLAAGYFVFDGATLLSRDVPDLAALDRFLRLAINDQALGDVPYQSAYLDNGDQQIIYGRRMDADENSRLVGFVVDPSGITGFMQRAFEAGPLLPPSLAGGRVSNELLFVELTSPDGEVLFDANRWFDSSLTVSRILGDDYQGILQNFGMRVSVDPASASSLLIGGLPASRLPLLLAVMAMTTITILTAMWLLRREQAVMRLRTDFVSQVSHELRTPLTQIRMFAETLLLDRAPAGEDSRRCLEIIDRESRRLSDLVENILRFSSISDAVQVECELQPLAPILRDVCDSVQATVKEAVVHLHADESVDAEVDADALRQVLLNLLDNAIKYGPADQEVTVTLSGSNGAALITVDDQGPGIPAAESQRVWTAFYRLEREQDTAISGTGIGLAVVRELVEAMRGRSWIDDASDGTRVSIEFPG